MDISRFPPIAVVLDGLYRLVIGLSDALSPLVGTSSTVLAIIALTAAVRLLLVPASLAHLRAEVTRRRLAPAIETIRLKFAGKPEQMQKALMQLYSDERVSPVAGCLRASLSARTFSPRQPRHSPTCG